MKQARRLQSAEPIISEMLPDAMLALLIVLAFSRHWIPGIALIPPTGMLEKIGKCVVPRIRSLPGTHRIARAVDRFVLPVINPLILSPAYAVAKSAPFKRMQMRAKEVGEWLRFQKAHLEPHRFTALGKIAQGLFAGGIVVGVSALIFPFHLAFAAATLVACSATEVLQTPVRLGLQHRRQALLRADPNNIGAWTAFKQRHGIVSGPVEALDPELPWWLVPLAYRNLRLKEAVEVVDALLPAGAKELLEADNARNKIFAYWNLVAAVKASMVVRRTCKSFSVHDPACKAWAALVVEGDTPGPLEVAEALHRFEHVFRLDKSIHLDKLGRLTRMYYEATDHVHAPHVRPAPAECTPAGPAEPDEAGPKPEPVELLEKQPSAGPSLEMRLSLEPAYDMHQR